MLHPLDFVVSTADLRRGAIEPGHPIDFGALQPRQVLLRVDRFAFTANNVTYAALGDRFGYFQFFPARPGGGRIPVWGFADVLVSRHDGLAAGERIYGFLPMSTHVVLDAGQITEQRLSDVAPHRAALPAFYNQYARCHKDPSHDRAREPLMALFQPLFGTAFLLDDFVAEREVFGARQIVITSASSKTALGLAHLLRSRGGARVVALTAPRNVDFIQRTGYHDQVVAYDALSTLPAEPTLYIDFAGDSAMLERTLAHLGARLQHCVQVGATHWERLGIQAAPAGPATTFFFAPEQLGKRRKEWGPAELQRRIDEATRAFFATMAWLRIVEHRGPEAVERLYRATLDGACDPAEGHLLSLAE